MYFQLSFNIALIMAAYVMGSLSSAVLVCKIWGLPDPRTQGSNNPGATNVLRIGGKTPAIITLFGDFLKGFILVFVSVLLTSPHWVIAGTMIAAFLGHLYPVFFQFKGGKGVATAMGTYLALDWIFGGILIGVWLSSILITRISSLGALIAALVAPCLGYFWGYDIEVLSAAGVMTFFLLLRHRSNISRLLNGTERKVKS